MSGAKRNAKKGNRCILLVWRGTTANVYSSRQGYVSLVFRRTQTHANSIDLFSKYLESL